LSPEGKVVAVVQMINATKDDSSHPFAFGKHEEELLQMLCSHCAVFMQQVEG
jgi:hypothetical protein